MAATILRADSACTKTPATLIDAFTNGQLGRAELMDRLLEWKAAGARPDDTRPVDGFGALRKVEIHGAKPFFDFGEIDFNDVVAGEIYALCTIVAAGLASGGDCVREELQASGFTAIGRLAALLRASLEAKAAC